MPTGYGWAEVWWFKTSTSHVIATTTSGTGNKVRVADGAYGVAIDYVSGRGIVGKNYKLAMRVPDGAPNAIYTYTGKWSPDSNRG